MDFRFTPEQEALRQEVADFLETEAKQGSFQPADYTWGDAYDPAFARRAGEKGLIGLAWPREYGGRGGSIIDLLLCTEEMTLRGAPITGYWIAERLVAPALIGCGTPEQRALFLPAIRRGELAFCMGLAEPGAGSDMASVETRAEARDGHFVVNGQKLFITGAHWSDWCFLLVRTGTPESRHRGLSVLLVDMKSPGVSVRPLASLYGTYPFNYIFLDNVSVPQRCLLGEKNTGWAITTTYMNYDRSSVELIGICRRVLNDLVEFAGSNALKNNAAVRQRLAELAVETEVGRWLCYRIGWQHDQGKPVDAETAIAKTFVSELMQRLANEGLRIYQLHGVAAWGEPGAEKSGWLQNFYMNCLARTIGGGSSEIMRSVLAQWGLGMPRESA